MSTIDMSVKITYVGDIVETNGTVDGQTITWTPVYGENTQISAKVKAPLSTFPIQLVIGLGVGLVLVTAFVLVIVVRSRKPGVQSAPGPDAEVTDNA